MLEDECREANILVGVPDPDVHRLRLLQPLFHKPALPDRNVGLESSAHCCFPDYACVMVEVNAVAARTRDIIDHFEADRVFRGLALELVPVAEPRAGHMNRNLLK